MPYPPVNPFCDTDAIVAQVRKAHDKGASFCKGYWPPAETKTKTIKVALEAHYGKNEPSFHGIATKTVTETETATITSSSTSTITCLNRAYTAEQPTTTVFKRDGYAANPEVLRHVDPSKVPLVCSCLSAPHPTVTVTKFKAVPGYEGENKVDYGRHTVTKTKTSTVTVTAQVVSTTITSNGLFYRKYESEYNAYESNSLVSTFFKNKKNPDWTGTLQTLTFASPGWPSGSTMLSLPDGRAPFKSDQSALLFNGFFIAKQTGTYIFSSSKDRIDNWGYLWVGDVAYRNWDDGNSAYKASRTKDGYFGGSYSLPMKKGDAVPLTWLWANGGGPAQSDFTITSPDGESTNNGEGYFVKACSSKIFI